MSGRWPGICTQCGGSYLRTGKNQKVCSHPCSLERKRELKKRAGTQKRYELRTKYGLSEFDYAAMLERSDNACEICGRREDLCVDHDHGTGQVRGILCRPCNLGLGRLGDDLEGLNRAHNYLLQAERRRVLAVSGISENQFATTGILGRSLPPLLRESHESRRPVGR